MARMADAEIERLKNEVSLVRLVESAGVALQRRGQEMVGRCPFHADDTPSLSVNAAKNLFRCFGCDAGGGPIDWVMKREGVSFRHAVELLRDGAALEPPASSPARSTVRRLAPPMSLDGDDQALLDQVVGYYHETLKRSPECQAYLAARGLVHPELIERFRLGYADRTLGLRLPEKNRKAGAEVRGRLERIGLYRASGHEHFRGSLVVPVIDAHGHVVEVYGRKTRDDLRPGTPMHLYLAGPHRGVWNLAGIAASGGEVILCEALIDAMTFWVAGYRNVTAAYGTGGFTDDHLAAFRAHDIARVLVAYDRDAAGDKGAAAIAEQLAPHGIGVYRVNLPKGMDANGYALNVTPAPKSLGALLRAAEWMAGTESRSRMVPFDDDPEPCSEPITVVETLPLSAAEPLSEPSHAGPIAPSPPPPVAAEIGEREVVIQLGDRTWRARGLARNASPEAMKINLMVRRGEVFHVDGLDLLSAKNRAAFVAEAALELGMPADAVKRDIGQVLLKLEAVQEELLRSVTSAPGVVISAGDEAAAMAWLKAPDLLDRIAADIAAMGVIGEAANALTVYLAP